MDKLDAMRLFVRVAELGSFSSVAQQMGVARSVITRQVAALETQLGTKLLARSTRRVSLTGAGAIYLEKCRVILNLVEVAETSLAEERQTLRGQIRLSLPLAFSQRHLAPLLMRFAAEHPEVSLDMDFSDRRSNLIQEGIDMAVRISTRLEPGDVVRKLGTARLAIYASPDYLARHGEPSRPEELAHHEGLVYTLGPRPQRWAFVIEGRTEMVPIHSRIQANNGDVLLQAAAQGMGLVCEPVFMAQPWLASGQLVEILKGYVLPELGIHAVLPGNRHVPHRLRVLIDYLAQSLQTDEARAALH